MEHYVQPIEETYSESIYNCLMQASGQTITMEQEEMVHQTTSSAFDDIEEKIARFCLELTECIKRENVGNLRKEKRQRQVRYWGRTERGEEDGAYFAKDNIATDYISYS